MGRLFPNMLVTGTPGTGKTTLCEQLVEMFPSNDTTIGFTHLNVGNLIKEQQLFTEWDDELDVPIFDDDLLINYLQEIMEDEKGGKLIDFHSAEILPSEWFDLIIVLRSDTNVLYDRLHQRGYSEPKIRENVESEIFQIVLDNIKEEHEGKVEIWEMPSNTIDQQNQILEKIRTNIPC